MRVKILNDDYFETEQITFLIKCCSRVRDGNKLGWPTVAYSLA